MSYIGALFIIMGYIGVINKNPAGFLVQFGGCMIMMLLFFNVDWGVFAVNFVFSVVNLVGWKKWKQQIVLNAEPSVLK